MDEIQEGERTLLDNSMVLFLSNMMTGNHDKSQLPVLLGGRAGGRMRSGTTMDFWGKGRTKHDSDPKRNICRLYLSIMQHMDVSVDEFGAASEPVFRIALKPETTVVALHWPILAIDGKPCADVIAGKQT